MKASWSCVVLALAALASGAAPPGKGVREPDPEPRKKNPLLGAWVERREMGGDLTITFAADGKLRFDDGGGRPEEGWYRLDSGKRPPPIDYVTPARANPRNGKPPLLSSGP